MKGKLSGEGAGVEAAEKNSEESKTNAVRSVGARLQDPDEPLYTIGVAAELLGTDVQSIRRLEETLAWHSARPSGNQRRYSRHEIEELEAALRLTQDGHNPHSV